MSDSVNNENPISTLKQDGLSLLGQVVEQLPDIGIGLSIFIVFFVLARPLSSLFIGPISHLTQSQLLQAVLRRTLSLLIILLGAYIFMRFAGLSDFAVALISGTGLVGLIVGFAFKDIAENFIASLLLSIQKPFRLGDVVEIEGYFGVINQVTSRATTLIDFDGNHIQIPNSTIYKGIMKNFTANPKMRIHFSVGIGYDVDIAHAQRLASKLITGHEAVLREPVPQVLVDSLGSSTVNLNVYFWVNGETISLLKAKSVFQKLIVSAFIDAGISMPDDARERILLTPNSDTDNKIAPHARIENVDLHEDESPTPEQEDLKTEVNDIRKQALHARQPETGDNIL